MIGIALLVIAIATFFISRYRWISLFIFLSFGAGSYGGFNLWTSEILGTNVKTLSFIYTISILPFVLGEKAKNLADPVFKWYKIYIGFLVLVTLVSLTYYGLSFKQVIQGGRIMYLITALPIFLTAKEQDLAKVMRIMVPIITVTSIIYIAQIVVGHPLMPYAIDYHNDSVTGLVRLYNSPYKLSFFLALSFVAPQYFKGNANFYRVLFVITLLATLGRTSILTSFLVLFLALLMNGYKTRIIRYSIIVILFIMPFSDIVIARFDNGGRTLNDINKIASGQAGADFSTEVGEGATLSYRLAWFYERAAYIAEATPVEKIFGLSLAADNDNWTNNRYNFNLGIINRETFQINQLSTPDISYGNLLTRLGFVGMFIYLFMLIKFAQFFYRNKEYSPLFLCAAANLIVLFITSISGPALSTPSTFFFEFMLIGCFLNNRTNNVTQSLRNNNML